MVLIVMFADSFNILKLIEVANKKTERHDQNDSMTAKSGRHL